MFLPSEQCTEAHKILEGEMFATVLFIDHDPGNVAWSRNRIEQVDVCNIRPYCSEPQHREDRERVEMLV